MIPKEMFPNIPISWWRCVIDYRIKLYNSYFEQHYEHNDVQKLKYCSEGFKFSKRYDDFITKKLKKILKDLEKTLERIDEYKKET